MRKAFKYKLYHSGRNKHLHSQIDLAAEIYNHAIALHKRYYRMAGKHLNIYVLKKHITKLKRLGKYRHWNGLGSQAVQDIVFRIEKTYRLFFKSLSGKRRGRVSPPGFKKRRKYRSFTLTQAGYEVLQGNSIRIGEHTFRYHKSRDIKGIIKTLTVKRDALGDLYIVFSCDKVPLLDRDRTMTGKSAGADFGLKTYLTLSDGNDWQSPEFMKRAGHRIRQANRVLSRRKKGSHNRSKARMSLARLHKKIANQRLDFSMKLARKMAIAYDHLFFETLNIDAMKRLWGRKVSDMGFSDYLKIQEHMCGKFGSVFETIPAFYPSTRTCHACGDVSGNVSLHDRSWICKTCGTNHDRDRNASIVIHMVGASNHWERSSKTSGNAGSDSVCIPESHNALAVGVRQCLSYEDPYLNRHASHHTDQEPA
jgi:putative transposase